MTIRNSLLFLEEINEVRLLIVFDPTVLVALLSLQLTIFACAFSMLSPQAAPGSQNCFALHVFHGLAVRYNTSPHRKRAGICESSVIAYVTLEDCLARISSRSRNAHKCYPICSQGNVTSFEQFNSTFNTSKGSLHDQLETSP